MADILTLSEYKALQGITETTYDAQLEVLIPMVNDYIENYCNREFGEGEYTERNPGVVDYYGRYVFRVKNRPLNEVLEVNLYFMGAQGSPASIDVSLMDVFTREGIAYYTGTLDNSIAMIRPEYADQFYYDITYSGGETVPPAVKLAASIMAADTFKYLQATVVLSGTQTGELKSVTLDDYSETYETTGSLFAQLHSKDIGMVLTPTVVNLLNPYKRVGIGLG